MSYYPIEYHDLKFLQYSSYKENLYPKGATELVGYIYMHALIIRKPWDSGTNILFK